MIKNQDLLFNGCATFIPVIYGGQKDASFAEFLMGIIGYNFPQSAYQLVKNNTQAVKPVDEKWVNGQLYYVNSEFAYSFPIDKNGDIITVIWDDILSAVFLLQDFLVGNGIQIYMCLSDNIKTSNEELSLAKTVFDINQEDNQKKGENKQEKKQEEKKQIEKKQEENKKIKWSEVSDEEEEEQQQPQKFFYKVHPSRQQEVLECQRRYYEEVHQELEKQRIEERKKREEEDKKKKREEEEKKKREEQKRKEEEEKKKREEEEKKKREEEEKKKREEQEKKRKEEEERKKQEEYEKAERLAKQEQRYQRYYKYLQNFGNGTLIAQQDNPLFDQDSIIDPKDFQKDTQSKKGFE